MILKFDEFNNETEFEKMEKKDNKNFVINKDGVDYWISRSVAVLGMVVAKKDGRLYALANKRGDGCPNYNGYWNMPCGFLDYNETATEAVAREVKEETGLELQPSVFQLFDVNSDPKDSKAQTVTLKYYALVDECYMDVELTNKYSEPNEIADIQWIPLEDIENYKWAFNHDKLLCGDIVKTF